MRVLRITAEGLTTSFRYPHFMLGVHPTFPMPPPATIYGHVCSALGEWVAPDSFRFAYHFTHEGEFTDLEHIHLVSPASGYLKGTRHPKVLEGNINPFQRHQLFRPRLTLYLDRPAWADAFRQPHYAVVLGRSQDLFTYREVRVLDLVQVERAYIEHTLLPHAMHLHVMRGVALTMPRLLDYSQARAPTFGRYLALTERVVLPPEDGNLRLASLDYGPFWVDPTTPDVRGTHRAVVWHRFTGTDDDTTLFA